MNTPAQLHGTCVRCSGWRLVSALGGLCDACEGIVEAILRAPVEGPRTYAEVRPTLQASLEAAIRVIGDCGDGLLPAALSQPAAESRRELEELLEAQDAENFWLDRVAHPDAEEMAQAQSEREGAVLQ